MMLTEETADHLGVSNRLDPRESIIAGARYLNTLKDLQGNHVQEPDRTWLALASYNIGPGHFNAARTLAKQLKADPTAWYEMKRILPLLAQPKYYERLKSGRARGGGFRRGARSCRMSLGPSSRSSTPIRAGSSGKPSGNPGLKLKAARINSSPSQKLESSTVTLMPPSLGEDEIAD